MDENELRRAIQRAGADREAARAAHAEAARQLGELIPAGRRAGLSVIEMADLAGITRTAVYDFLKQS